MPSKGPWGKWHEIINSSQKFRIFFISFLCLFLFLFAMSSRVSCWEMKKQKKRMVPSWHSHSPFCKCIHCGEYWFQLWLTIRITYRITTKFPGPSISTSGLLNQNFQGWGPGICFFNVFQEILKISQV